MVSQNCPHCLVEQEIGRAQPGEEIRCVGCGTFFRVSLRDKKTPIPRDSVISLGPFAKKDARRPRPTPKRLPHLKIEGYEIKECLGRGGMGQVYRAIQKSLGRDVAIKTLDSNLARNQASVMRFTKEAAAMAKLSHPNIVSVIDRGVVRQHHYFIMEFVDGASLRDVLHDGAFAPQQALRIMQQLSRTMEYAHSQGVVHRDLKPENILYTKDGVLKVADFGLAGVQEETTYIRKLTKSFVSMGTECYMAPEQRRDAKNVDMRADIYSMGVIFYELMTNELPIPHAPLPDDPIVPDHPEIDALIRRCMQLSPNARYAHTSELCEALEKVMESLSKAETPKPVRHDTVVDAPDELDEAIALNHRLTAWPSRIQSSIAEMASGMGWYTPRTRQMLWSTAFLGLLAIGVGLFFLYAPKPPVPENKLSDQEPSWHKQQAKLKRLADGRYQVHFDFARRKLVPINGVFPRKQWKLPNANWNATPNPNTLNHNTYRREYVRNSRTQWALYKGHSLAFRRSEFKATVQLKKPFVPEQGKFIPLISYLKTTFAKGNAPKLYPTVGLGFRGKGKAEFALLLHPGKHNLRYTMRYRAPVSARVPRPSYEVHRGHLKKSTFRYSKPFRIAIKVQNNQATAWINGERLEHFELDPRDNFSAYPGFVCRDAHCHFEKFSLQASLFDGQDS